MKLHFLLPAVLLAACTTPAPPQSSAAPVTENRIDGLKRALHDPAGRVMIAAHRGCWHHGPENSIKALDACIAMGIDIAEIDIRLTADGELVLSHDASLGRVAGVDRPVSAMSLSEVQSVKLRQGLGGADGLVTAEHVPTFRQVLEAVDRRMLLILDLQQPIPATARAAARILRETGNCDIAMFALVAPPGEVRERAGDLLDCAAYLPNLRPDMGEMAPTVQSYAGLDPVAVAVRFPKWTYLESGRAAPRSLGARLWVNTLYPEHAAGLTDKDALREPRRLWGRLMDNGVNMIQTDEPEALQSYLASRATETST